MYRFPKILLVPALLGVASISIAQEPYRTPHADVLARLSYDNSGVVQRGNGNVRHVCIAVSREGEYRIVRSTDEGQTERLHGEMPQQELNQLSKLLESADFRNLSGNGSSLVRQEAETFVAEIALGGRWRDDGHGTKWLEPQNRRLQWLNADGDSPFPLPIGKVVDWVKGFEPKNAKWFERTEFPHVCPSDGIRPVQPVDY
jgi:hypothetical protein